MSLTYYLINKDKKEINIKYKENLNNLEKALTSNFVNFFNEHNLDKINDAKEKIKNFIYDVEFLCNPQEIKICKSSAKCVVFDKNEYFSNFYEFKEFYKENSKIYSIEDEYEEEYTFEEMINKLNIKINKTNEERIYFKR